jgi:hypothetical protein
MSETGRRQPKPGKYGTRKLCHIIAVPVPAITSSAQGPLATFAVP